ALKSPHLFESLLNKGDSLTLKPTANNRASLQRPLCQRHDVVGHSFHDALVLRFISVPVVHVRDSAFAVVLYSVHCVAAEAEPSYGAAVSTPQVVRRNLVLDAEALAYLPHGEAEVARQTAARAGEDEASGISDRSVTD